MERITEIESSDQVQIGEQFYSSGEYARSSPKSDPPIEWIIKNAPADAIYYNVFIRNSFFWGADRWTVLVFYYK